jgi:hypothetical protein
LVAVLTFGCPAGGETVVTVGAGGTVADVVNDQLTGEPSATPSAEVIDPSNVTV